MNRLLPTALATVMFASCAVAQGARTQGGGGQALYAKGEFEAAVEAFAQDLTQHPDRVHLHYNLGLAAWRAGDLDRAERSAEVLVARGDEKLQGLGRSLLGSLRYDAARAAMQEDPGAALDLARRSFDHMLAAARSPAVTEAMRANAERALRLKQALEQAASENEQPPEGDGEKEESEKEGEGENQGDNKDPSQGEQKDPDGQGSNQQQPGDQKQDPNSSQQDPPSTDPEDPKPKDPKQEDPPSKDPDATKPSTDSKGQQDPSSDQKPGEKPEPQDPKPIDNQTGEDQNKDGQSSATAGAEEQPPPETPESDARDPAGPSPVPQLPARPDAQLSDAARKQLEGRLEQHRELLKELRRRLRTRRTPGRRDW